MFMKSMKSKDYNCFYLRNDENTVRKQHQRKFRHRENTAKYLEQFSAFVDPIHAYCIEESI